MTLSAFFSTALGRKEGRKEREGEKKGTDSNNM